MNNQTSGAQAARQDGRAVLRLGVLLLIGFGVLIWQSWPPPKITAEPVIDTQLGAPTGLVLTKLDSTIRAMWKPSGDPNVAWQVFSTWDGDTLVGAKLVGPTTVAADANGLNADTLYTIQVQSMDAAGNLSAPLTAYGRVDPQPPMANAAFFENFNATYPGALDPNYFDVRIRGGDSDPVGAADKMIVVANEKHYHTQVIGGGGTGGVLIRPRVPFDFAGRTGTFQFEVDLAPVQRAHGKWFEVSLSQHIAGHEHQFGDGQGAELPNSIEFSVRAFDASLGVGGYNYPQIKVNVNGVKHLFIGQTPLVTYANVRVPIVLKVSQTRVEMYVNGMRVVEATGFTLPFTRGYWNILHRNYYAGRIGHIGYDKPPITAVQLVHWDMIQFDGPAGSINPVVRAYVQPGCAPIVTYSVHEDYVASCDGSLTDGTTTINIPDDLSNARSALLLFNGKLNDPPGDVTINGHTLPLPTPFIPDLYAGQINEVEVPVEWLVTGANQVTISSPTQYLANAVFEVVFNEPRVMTNPHMHPMAMIGTTSQNFRIEHINGDPPTVTRTAYLYSLGSAEPAPYTATVQSDTPWLQITSGANGVLTSPVLGGPLVPLTFSVNAAMVGETGDDGAVGYIRVDGGSMPVHIAVILQKFNRDYRYNMVAPIPPTLCAYNKLALPHYASGVAGAPPPAGTPSAYLPIIERAASFEALGCDLP